MSPVKGAPYWVTLTEVTLMQAEVEHYADVTGCRVLDTGALGRLTWEQLDALHLEVVRAPKYDNFKQSA